MSLTKQIEGTKILKEWVSRSDNKDLDNLVRCWNSVIFDNNRKEIQIEELKMQVKALTKQLIDAQVKEIAG